MCDSGRDESLVTAYAMTEVDGNSTLITKSFDLLETELDGAEVGRKFEIEIVQLKQWQYEDLDEFEGF